MIDQETFEDVLAYVNAQGLQVVNAFSLQMLGADAAIRFAKLGLEQAKQLARTGDRSEDGIDSYVGHESTAAIASKLLGAEIPFRREPTGWYGSPILAIQYKGARLPEGATELPEGTSFEYWLIY